ncbi:G-protein coupled receptor dmsr-1 [Wyeomyia smithii]|uniref:G-protein coupled receptor dmsr-1 n=1 Tax=Wyeomyia smithii TaxID=174621 RepID=UPI002467EFBA|nr:G-protein coupled receptor dmsr-1 [Wyeomyia smithii]XP_055528419.1 G-protein coupled receptor dmsr-1 [Wyeomyia smithii]XP_055528420.1 G-protein coupled receptor dmsr-1 [Wyeomyia smithii]XP_055528421.1 G-protein coupled receptor dmsr-1 [Wyeomyia smithii]XP_055528422.1 G-protein coupled receptor dmsr-1 [Wyeomyia smithii]XP_055528423.1 G-protein coupled receptor dmsr-1 [Wyeomyia smithii]XP_055528425.1 G-protein coupled receptor dmsr-1 [Wyeomyia smithii]
MFGAEERVLEWFHYIYHNDSSTTLILNATEFRRRFFTILDSNLTSAMNGSGKLYQHAFEFQNISEHNITHEYVNDFLEKLFQSLNRLNRTVDASWDDGDEERINCSNYCKGAVRDLMTDYKVMHGYITLVICVFGTIANIFNIIVLTRKEMSKIPINRILKWLSVTDMFVMIEYIPFAFYMYSILPDRRDYPYSWAVYLMFHMHFTQILHTISILLTVTLAVWRYIAIKRPHSSLALYAQTNYSYAILLCYLLAPILCMPTYFVFTIRQTSVFEHDTHMTLYHLGADENTSLYRYNFWIHSVIIKLLPCMILTVISCILIHVLWKASKRRLRLKQGVNYNCENGTITAASEPSHATSNNNPVTYSGSNATTTSNGSRHPKADRRADRTTTLLVAVLLLFLFTEFPQGILGLLSGILEKCFFRRCYDLFGEVMDLLALINAAIGFVLYGLMSKQFRTSFKSVFCNAPTHRVEITRMTGITTTCV